jgi:hypothetical protein
LEAVASPAREADPDMPYQIIDVAMARSLQDDAARDHPLFGWIIMQDLPEYPGAFVARLVTDAPNAIHPAGSHAG